MAGSLPDASAFCDTTSSHIPKARKMWVVMCWACAASGAIFEYARAAGDAVALMRQAAALEDAMPVEFGPPADVKPAHELLGEILLRTGRPKEAQREFARQLQLAPKRALSLLGLGRAAAAAGDGATAARAYAELRAIWHRADPDRPELAEAARFLATRP